MCESDQIVIVAPVRMASSVLCWHNMQDIPTSVEWFLDSCLELNLDQQSVCSCDGCLHLTAGICQDFQLNPRRPGKKVSGKTDFIPSTLMAVQLLLCVAKLSMRTVTISPGLSAPGLHC
jgi:hypothetical protein